MSSMHERPEADALPPLILVGGSENTLSVARHLAPLGIAVHAIGSPDSVLKYSRHLCFIPIEAPSDPQPAWLEWLTTRGAESLRGAVLIPCNDDGLELVARHRAELDPSYRVYEADDQVLLAMLDKGKTYALADKLGIPAPRTFIIETAADLRQASDRINYPCALKPRHGHVFRRHIDGKLLVIKTEAELTQAFERLDGLGIEVILTEIIAAESDDYCSYYSYLDEHGQPLYHFTKRKLRQYPVRFGSGTYHQTDWNPEVAEIGLRFFQGVGLRGVGNVEFKLDPKDGKYKLIECNPRFTMAHELIEGCGLPMALFVYNRLAGRDLPKMTDYRRGEVEFGPLDFLAFLGYRRRDELTAGAWLASVLRRHHCFYFAWTDPGPALVRIFRFWRRWVGARFS